MTPRELLISVKAAKTLSATRVESPGQKGHYLSAYLSVFKVYSHELMPGEIIAICKQNRKPQWVPRLRAHQLLVSVAVGEVRRKTARLFFAENWRFVTSKSPPLRKGACSYLDKLQRSQAVSGFSCATHILTIQVLELVPMKESLSTWVSLLSRKGVWDLFWPRARMHS